MNPVKVSPVNIGTVIMLFIPCGSRISRRHPGPVYGSVDISDRIKASPFWCLPTHSGKKSIGTF